MRRSIALVLMLGFALSLPVVPAFADDEVISQASGQFPALAGLNAALVPMTDEQLAAVEGMGTVCFICINVALIKQTNVSVFSFKGVTQTNAAAVSQSIN
jgi:hypothetical protein